jgi:hypothetical protein
LRRVIERERRWRQRARRATKPVDAPVSRPLNRLTGIAGDRTSA